MEGKPPQHTQESLEFPEIKPVVLPHDPPQDGLSQRHTDQGGSEVILISPEDILPLPEVNDRVIPLAWRLE